MYTAYLLLILLLSNSCNCLRCHKCTVVGLEDDECPNLTREYSNGTFYLLRDSSRRTSSGLRGDPHFCENGDACYIKESMLRGKSSWIIDTGCFQFAHVENLNLLNKALGKKKPLICQTDIVSKREKHYTCLCTTHLCNYARKKGLLNHPDTFDYEPFAQKNMATLCNRVSIKIIFISSIGHSLSIMCHNCTVTHTHPSECAEDILYDYQLGTVQYKKASGLNGVSHCRTGNACYVRSWYSRHHYAWIVQGSCYTLSDETDNLLSHTFKMAKSALYCKKIRYVDAEYELCFCRSDLCNVSRPARKSSIFGKYSFDAAPAQREPLTKLIILLAALVVTKLW